VAKEFLSEYKIVRKLTRGIDDEKPQKTKEITSGASPQKRPNRRQYRRRPNKQATVDKKE
jgi:hypothetical protein